MGWCFRLLSFVLLICTLGQAQSRIDCSAINSRILAQPVHYCVYLPAGYDAEVAKHSARRYPVLYFLHGLGGNEQSLFNGGGWSIIDDLRRQNKIGDLLIVAPEGRSSFYINAADGRVLYSDFFLKEFMPNIESKYRIQGSGGDRKARGVTGLSMGGYGALRFAFAHPELFSSVSAQSAALMTESPAELNEALRAGTPVGRLLGGVFGRPINAAHWKTNDPLTLAKKNQAALRKVAIYFNCGNRDEYGFEKGAEELHRQLDAEHIAHEFHLYPGDHSLNYFLEHLPETLEFHWRAFEVGK